LTALGVYAHSVKPEKDWLEHEITDPKHILINISESALAALIPTHLPQLIENGRVQLRRVYPRGTRIESGNQDPLACWRSGSHFAALNWQDFDRGMQLNEAMFNSTGGWIAKPSELRGGLAPEGTTKVSLNIVGLSALPRPGKAFKFSIRVRTHILHASGDKEWKSSPVHLTDVPETGADAFVNEHCELEFATDELAFVRILITRDELGTDEHLAIFCARVPCIQQGWRFVRLLDTKGKDSHATLLANFAIEQSGKSELN